MEFRYSKLVDPEKYSTDGLFDGIPLRVHKDAHREVKGALRCQRDWSDRVSPLTNYHGTVGPRFSFVTTCIPEALPDRVEIASYANEYAFIYDDVIMENVDQSLSSRERSEILQEFSEDVTHKQHLSKSYKLQGAKEIQAQILAEMMAIDKPRAITTMKSWQRFIDVTASRQRTEPFKGLADYLPYRISDAGELFWFGLVTFAMGITIPEHEMDLCKTLGRPTWEALVLTNDLYSWEKERDDAARAGHAEVVNAVWVIMKEHSVSEPEAKKICELKIKESVAQALQVADKTKRDRSLSPDLRKYTEAMLYSISGNLVWSIYCPRYHPDQARPRVERARRSEASLASRPSTAMAAGL